jgi:hypothetical protein
MTQKLLLYYNPCLWNSVTPAYETNMDMPHIHGDLAEIYFRYVYKT